MAKPGFVYAKFFSGEPVPEGYELARVGPDASKAGPGIAQQGAQRGPEDRGAPYELRRNGLPLARLMIGRGGSCIFGKSGHPLPQDAFYAHGLAVLPEGGPGGVRAGVLKTLFACIEECGAGDGAGRLLFCSPSALGPDELALTGLYLIGSYDAIAPLRMRVLARPAAIGEKALDALRARAPGIAAFAAGALSASPLRKYLIEGKISGRPLRVSFNGPAKMARFYSGVLFSGGQSSMRPLPLGMALGALPADMEAAWLPKASALPPGATVLPAFTRSIMDVGPSFERYLASLPKSAVSDISKIRAAGFEAAHSREFVDFLIFYHSMYLPMLATRHRSHTLETGFEELAGFFRRGFLLFVKRGKSVAAGMITIECNGTLLAKTMGVAAGRFSRTLEGANSAVIYHLIKHAYDRRLAIVDMGYSSPFQSDGVLRFKAKWGVRNVADRTPDILSMRFREEGVRQLVFSALRPLTLDSLERYSPPEISP